MNQEEWLIQYIASAFAHAQLGDGIDVHAAQSMKDHGNPKEDRLSMTAERNDWQRVPCDILFSRHCAVAFLDVEGFRFYTPAIMTAIIRHGDDHGLLLDTFLFNLKVTIHGKIKDVEFRKLFDQHQRAAILRFLKYLIHHTHYGCDAASRLDEIKNRTPR